MTRLELANNIIKGGDFEIKSHNFGDCRIINGEDFIVLYDDTKSPAFEIARWRKEFIATYLDYINNPNKYDNAPFETYEKIDREAYMVDSILSFINIDKTMEV